MRRVVLACVLVGCGGGGGGGGGGDGGATDAAVVDTTVADAPVDGMSPFPMGAPPVGLCRDHWCWVQPTPQGNQTRSFWGTSATDVWALADRGTLLHYDGSAWTNHAAPLTWGDGGGWLWGTSATDVWAANRGAVLHWNGTAWSDAGAGVTTANALGGTGPNDVWVYDFTSANMRQWNGATWTTRALPNTQWRTVAFGGDSTGVISVSMKGGIAKWLGSSWGIADGGTFDCNAAVVIDATHVVLAQNNTVAFWNGTNWTVRVVPGAGDNWTKIAARSFTDVWVAGERGGRAHWDGANWTLAAQNGDRGDKPTALWQDSTGAPWLAIDDATVHTWNGTVWSALTSGDAQYIAAYGTADDDIWTLSHVRYTTSRWRARHWDGTSWSEVAFPFDDTYQVSTVWGSAPNDYWVAGGRRALGDPEAPIEHYMFHWDGTAWTSVGPLGEDDHDYGGFGRVWGSSANDVYVAGRALLFHYDGTTWSPVPDITITSGGGLFGIDADHVYVLDGMTLHQWNGTAWSAKTMPETAGSGWANSPTDIWISGSSHLIHYDGTFFTVMDADHPAGRPFGSSSEMFMPGLGVLSNQAQGTMSRWTGGPSSTPERTQAYFDVGDGFRTPSGLLYAYGEGLLVHAP